MRAAARLRCPFASLLPILLAMQLAAAASRGAPAAPAVAATQPVANAREPAEACREYLLEIGRAIESYRRDNRGELPPHLSALHPKYLPDKSALHCPADRSEGTPYAPFFPPEWRLDDPALKTSYSYLHADTRSPALFISLSPQPLPRGATLRERMAVHRANFGDSIPLVQCHHHFPEFRQDLLPGGRVWRYRSLFEQEPRTYPFVLRRLAADLAAGKDAVLKNWEPLAVEEYFVDWAAAPHTPAELALVGAAAVRLDKLAGEIRKDDRELRASVLRTAARFHAAAGNFNRARDSSFEAGALTRDQPGEFLVMLYHHLADARRREPPVEDYLKWESRRRNLPGVSVAVIQNGQPMEVKSTGMANLELQAPATPDTAYRIASITKTFVATAVMMLVEEGKLSLDDKVTRLIPGAPASWEGIRLRHLLSHTAGLDDLWDMPPEARPRELSSPTLVKTLASLPLKAAPGERNEYNHGALLLGVVIEHATGKPFGEFLAERIFRPLGMTATRLDDPHAVIRNRATNYSWDDAGRKWVHPDPLPPAMWSMADGGIISTVNDLAKWDAALREGKVLKEQTLEQMWAPTKLNDGSVVPYGLGWQVGSLRGHPWVGHSGGGPSSTRILRFHDPKLTIIVLCNFDRGDATKIADDLAALYLPPPRPIQDQEPEITRADRGVIAGLADGKADAADLSPAARDALAPDAAETSRFLRSLGDLNSFKLVERSPTPAPGAGAGGQLTRRYVATFSEFEVTWLFTFTHQDGKVSSVEMQAL